MEVLENAYQGNTDFWFLSNRGQIADYWIKKAKYSDYDKFNELFDEDLGVQQHTDHGGAILKYNPDFKYPYQIDKEEKYCLQLDLMFLMHQ